MNPQLTTTVRAGANAQFFVATQAVSRAMHREETIKRFDPAIADKRAVDATERSRQDALSFLHWLVMG